MASASAKTKSVGSLRALTCADQSYGVLASSPIFLNDASQFVFGYIVASGDCFDAVCKHRCVLAHLREQGKPFRIESGLGHDSGNYHQVIDDFGMSYGSLQCDASTE